jgi:hypothetical protein
LGVVRGTVAGATVVGETRLRVVGVERVRTRVVGVTIVGAVFTGAALCVEEVAHAPSNNNPMRSAAPRRRAERGESIGYLFLPQPRLR